MPQPDTFNDRIIALYHQISPAERVVAKFVQDNRADVLISSASVIAKNAGTSDATVVRTAKALGYSGLEEMRKALAQEIRETTSPASRMARTIKHAGNDLEAAFNTTLDINQAALEDLRNGISPDIFQTTVDALTGARRVFIFGIGPSGAMADYLALGLARLGLNTTSLVQTGVRLADQIRPFEKGDILILFAYGQIYREVTALLDHADRHSMLKILITDSLGLKLRHRVDQVLPVARGRINMLSMHTATLALIEALIVGVATQQPEESLASLENLNLLRVALSDPALDLKT